ncbi:hypothetical protein KR074_006119 [Drosophila pseudoananassae]|nr:hypothetical protein KR074_006119 [Drosophila pseudoananassae]
MHEEMTQEDPQCRICLLQPKDESLMPTEPNFVDQIRSCTGIQMTETSNRSNLICTSCALLLRAALKLRTLCQEAQKKLERKKDEVPAIVDEEKDDVEDSESDAMFEEYVVTLDGTEYSSDGDEIISIEPADSLPPSPIKEQPSSMDGGGSSSEPEDSSTQALLFSCNLCPNVYSQRVKLTEHLKVHNNDKPHECEICNKKFRQTTQLARHMNSHTGNRPYKCDFCDSCFGDPSTRIKHQRIHTNERPYKCKFCTKTFSYSNVLRVHIKTHTGERPYSCQYCHKKFSQPHHRKYHEKTHK